jgi:hypothetical protein
MTTQTPLDYQTPQHQPQDALRVPATILIVLGSLTLGAIILDFLSRVVGRTSGFSFHYGVHIGPPESAMGFNALSVILIAVMIVGSLQMMRCRNYPLAMTAAVLAIVPFTTTCCCFLTLPVGIWALLLLQKPEIKAAFH